MRHIYVGNIGSHITEAALRQEFETYGRVKDVQVQWNFALVEMIDDKAAQQAVSDLNSRTAWVLRSSPTPFAGDATRKGLLD